MTNGYFRVRAFKNKPGLGYNPTGAVKDELLRTLAEMRNGIVDIPLMIGGNRASGTNDKAGSIINMLKWVSPQAVKESYDATIDYRY